MPNIFTITPQIKAVATQAFDSLINQLGRNCQLFYPPKMERCANCLPDPIGKKSSNRYLDGGPAPFPMGSICPVCGGAGFRAIETSDIVNLLINEDPKNFTQVINNVNLPAGTIETKGYVTDLPKVLKCDYMVKHIDMQAMLQQRYKLHSEPIIPGNIIQGRYFVALWERHA